MSCTAALLCRCVHSWRATGPSEGSEGLEASSATAATYTGMCIFGISFSLGYTIGAYLIGETLWSLDGTLVSHQ